MQKEGRASGGAECGGNFLCDDSALAHAGDDDAAAGLPALNDKVDGSLKICSHRAFEPSCEVLQRFGFNADELCRGVFRHCDQTLWMVSKVPAAPQKHDSKCSVVASLKMEEVTGRVDLKRNYLVSIVVLAALVLMVWAGVTNYRRRKAEQVRLQEMQAVLVPAAPGASADQAAAPEEEMRSPLEGKPAPAFTLETLQGQKVSLASYKGKAVLVISERGCAPQSRRRLIQLRK